MPDAKIMYLCYFGLRESLVQTQVLPYLREINKLDRVRISLLTFEPDLKRKWTTEEIEAEKKKLSEEGIAWHFLPYHKRPSAPATLYDVLAGARLIRKLIRREGIDLLHARVHVPALMGAIARKFLSKKPKLLFDVRGFFPEEYTDAGIWKENGWLYRSVKRVEKWLLKDSDGFVVLTEKARSILFPESKETGFDLRGRPVEVIPCCVDFKRFESADRSARAGMRRRLGVEDRFVIVYVGSFGGWYLTEEMTDFLRTAREKNPRTFALVLTQSPPQQVAELLRKRGFTDRDFFIDKVPPSEVPDYLSASDASLSLIKACYSKQSSSPTKIAEYLVCGLPIVSNSGVGDLDDLIEGEKVGVIINEFNRSEYARAFDRIVRMSGAEDFREHSRQIAGKMFDLETVGGARYQRIYRTLLKRND
ncbi:MAG: glycosyltransferase [Pyrinomonadaceae bacterium]